MALGKGSPPREPSAIGAFAPAGTFLPVRQFHTPEGAPKSVWSHRDSGAMVLLGSLPPHWPPPERLEALLPWLNAWTPLLSPRTDGLVLRHYHRSLAGPYGVAGSEHRHFLATYHPGARPSLPADGLLLARALATFHRVGRRQLERQGPPFAEESLEDLLQHWLLPGLQAACGRVPADLRPPLEGALKDLSGLKAQRRRALDGLPRCLVHGDWQAKNLMVCQASAAHGSLLVLDSESCRLFPRMFDVYFLLSWDDACRGWRHPDRAKARLRHYLECSGGLSPAERELLPDLLRIKALSNALWSTEGPPPERGRLRARRAVLRHSLTMAEAMASLDVSVLP